ncbi:hypothetical protein BJ742DRAFT_785426 [Cladochytrium replicatum]|nr:hypothetical protein BJ742DRAFT_785426 [Cladochytrium replicatum]
MFWMCGTRTLLVDWSLLTNLRFLPSTGIHWVTSSCSARFWTRNRPGDNNIQDRSACLDLTPKRSLELTEGDREAEDASSSTTTNSNSNTRAVSRTRRWETGTCGRYPMVVVVEADVRRRLHLEVIRLGVVAEAAGTSGGKEIAARWISRQSRSTRTPEWWWWQWVP